MTEADIVRIIESQGYTSSRSERVSARGDGTSTIKITLYSPAPRRNVVYLGKVKDLAELDEQALIALINQKISAKQQRKAGKS